MAASEGTHRQPRVRNASGPFTLASSLKLSIIPAIIAILSYVFFNSALFPASPPSARVVYQFPNGTWVENIAARANGNLLVTLVNVPELWEIDPSSPPAHESTAKLIHRFPDTPMLTGITEIAPDTFAIGSPQTLWRADLTTSPPSISPIVSSPSFRNLNGLATLDPSHVLAADSMLGVVWRIDVDTGAHEAVLQHDTMAPTTDLGPLVGVNGLGLLLDDGDGDGDGDGDYLYYNNCPRALLCRVRIDRATARAAGPYEVVAERAMADDFALGADGAAYLAGLVENVVTRVGPDGAKAVVAGATASRELAGATAAAWGRAPRDEGVLYVTTGGIWGVPVTETVFEGGKVMAVRV
ncbi:hypothetical protein B0J12DRAFT_685842 [Macrophomina phaseolina]|uniref:Six-bladed beta-propeller TolB-like protein n=1 Tax=Macrophomina phaseolina TaxID=35725 RepID=A0ABQ8FTI0_9PEZI|nr:hypothetical protein B0J12DRAFT_685842 [Macrophomina phaseolina]